MNTTATPTHDPDYTIQSNINVTWLFYIMHTQLLIGVMNNITVLVMNSHGPATVPHPQSMISLVILSIAILTSPDCFTLYTGILVANASALWLK